MSGMVLKDFAIFDRDEFEAYFGIAERAQRTADRMEDPGARWQMLCTAHHNLAKAIILGGLNSGGEA